MLPVRVVITLLCAVGFYASVFMSRKAVMDAQGRLQEQSVVQSPRARLFGGVPNAFIGIVYYPAVLAVSWFGNSFALAAALGASIVAAGTSLYLAYSLLFVTRRSCPFCFLSHTVNLALVAVLGWLLVL